MLNFVWYNDCQWHFFVSHFRWVKVCMWIWVP